MRRDRPPRPVAVGDVVTVYSEALRAWTASQVTGIDTTARCAAVLELDWSGPEPSTVADLGDDVQPLRLTHHSWGGTLSHCNHGWVLPRSFRVIGSLPPLVTAPSRSYSAAWGRGEQLARQRRWDSGDHEDWNAPYALTRTADELAEEYARNGVRPDVKHLTVRGITRLDCTRLVAAFPNLTRLSLSGNLGTLASAAALNQLPRLQELTIHDLFGMEPTDCLLPRQVPDVENLSLYGIPADYADAMRKTWRPHVQDGVELEISGARKPEWIAANAANPLRDWDGRQHITRTSYRKAVAQYKATREAFRAEVAGDEQRGDILEIGRAFGAAFNALDRRTGFIETVEREELFDALDFLVEEAQEAAGRDLSTARAALVEGVDSIRDW
ncbi:leucine-rich repeat domain-containing protein [Streptomyces sp. NPDC060187]|uniref:leucine-rich repeat domain-containing protein n=1 Tax=Streptomyces sp. NPDC060187 TaxID=3347067 RepID=UPI0036634284